MMRVLRAAALIAVSTGFVACKNVAPDGGVPAVIVEPDEASRAALQGAVNAALDMDVMLARDALTDSSVLYIERRMRQSLDGTPLQGRNLDTPLEFRLLMHGASCILIDQRDGSRHILADTRCKAEE
jgi:hypothetical protein